MTSILKFSLRNLHLSRDRGVALVVVLWIFIFLFVVAFNFSSSVREEGMATHHYTEEAEGYYLALAGFEKGLFHLLEERAEQSRGLGAEATLAPPQEIVDGRWHKGNLGEGVYRVRLVDEGGKINLNRADSETLGRIFENLNVEEPRRTILIDSILDWRDRDDLHRTNGAENDYYLSLSPPYTAKNGTFDAVEDLLWVRGMSRELFYGQGETGDDDFRKVGLNEIFTVDSPMNRVNLRTASATVIRVLVGLSLEKSQEFVKEREQLSEKTLADLMQLLGITAGNAALRQFVFTTPSVITIEALGHQAESSTQRRVRGVVRVVGGNRGFELVRWVDRETGRL
ncbi:MAG: general secretion pathway protein GspK [Candidatus Binatia bacterium]